jgi:hypothetical protein
MILCSAIIDIWLGTGILIYISLSNNRPIYLMNITIIYIILIFYDIYV